MPCYRDGKCIQIYIVIATLEGLAIVIFEDDGATFSLFATSAAVDDLVFLAGPVDEEEEEGAAIVYEVCI